MKFVGTAVGNVVSHEIGHFIGSFHVDQFNDTLNLMDQGGNFAAALRRRRRRHRRHRRRPGRRLRRGRLQPGEGFTGIEDTLNNSAWGFITGQGG